LVKGCQFLRSNKEESDVAANGRGGTRIGRGHLSDSLLWENNPRVSSYRGSCDSVCGGRGCMRGGWGVAGGLSLFAAGGLVRLFLRLPPVSCAPLWNGGIGASSQFCGTQTYVHMPHIAAGSQWQGGSLAAFTASLSRSHFAAWLLFHASCCFLLLLLYDLVIVVAMVVAIPSWRTDTYMMNWPCRGSGINA
jgi:hypothetical protein